MQSIFLNLKTKTLRASSLRSYKSNVNVFKTWLRKNRKGIKLITEIQKKDVVTF